MEPTRLQLLHSISPSSTRLHQCFRIVGIFWAEGRYIRLVCGLWHFSPSWAMSKVQILPGVVVFVQGTDPFANPKQMTFKNRTDTKVFNLNDEQQPATAFSVRS